MSGLAFFDTNILLYTDDGSAPAKQARALELFIAHLRQGSAIVSLQVLQEYYSAATRKLGVDPALAQRKVELLATCHVVKFGEQDVIAAIELHRLSKASFWDSLILHAARVGGASVLYSEDFSHSTTPAGVPVVNPFL
ncbi:MAG: PIN domain-containing protein [Candidatus Solibacter usitatus]|nr:PIN domain-containing protein [Candidatus Solibacter usitatus]